MLLMFVYLEFDACVSRLCYILTCIFYLVVIKSSASPAMCNALLQDVEKYTFRCEY